MEKTAGMTPQKHLGCDSHVVHTPCNSPSPPGGEGRVSTRFSWDCTAKPRGCVFNPLPLGLHNRPPVPAALQVVAARRVLECASTLLALALIRFPTLPSTLCCSCAPSTSGFVRRIHAHTPSGCGSVRRHQQCIPLLYVLFFLLRGHHQCTRPPLSRRRINST